jgi:hypothetical protein
LTDCVYADYITSSRLDKTESAADTTSSTLDKSESAVHWSSSRLCKSNSAGRNDAVDVVMHVAPTFLPMSRFDKHDFVV